MVAAQYDVRRRRRLEPDLSNCCCCVPCRKPVKNVEAPFTKVAQDPRVKFLGNVTLGKFQIEE